jgi:hypothetical protein
MLPDELVNSCGEGGRVRVAFTRYDAFVVGVLKVQSNEIATVEREHCPVDVACQSYRAVVGDSFASASVLLQCQHLVP